MKPWYLACLVACFVAAWAPAVHTQGAFEDCCLNYHTHAKWFLLRRARGFQLQDVSGSCNLRAVIFYLPQAGKMVCGDPEDHAVKKAMRLLEHRARTSQKPRHGTRMNFQGFPAGRKKMHSGMSKLRDPSSSKRNVSLS